MADTLAHTRCLSPRDGYCACSCDTDTEKGWGGERREGGSKGLRASDLYHVLPDLSV